MATALERPSAALLDRIDEVPVLPHIIFSMLEPVGPSDPRLDDLERSISLDPGLAVKVLVLANANSSGSRELVQSLPDAVATLGYRTLRTVAMTAGTFETFVGKNDVASLRRRRWWRHSMDTAAIAAQVARQSREVAPEEARTAGLIHLIGKSLLDRYCEADYDQVDRLVAEGQSDWMAEKAVCGCSHIDLMIALCQQWRLPPRLCDAMLYTEAPEPGREHMPLRACVTIGTSLASAALLSRSDARKSADSTPAWALAVLGLAPEQLRFLVADGIGALSICQD